eukprot:TRINITY_DN3066_c0_g1_i2.p1 TRINITY_DN3066_c0_g1~~TRINITY_DN3066_c0_g1_i2.p1  ORF type:complete len:435 (+),score=39.46 TRINITY_DN3066_c0_g1_i2:210-1514(+)
MATLRHSFFYTKCHYALPEPQRSASHYAVGEMYSSSNSSAVWISQCPFSKGVTKPLKFRSPKESFRTSGHYCSSALAAEVKGKPQNEIQKKRQVGRGSKLIGCGSAIPKSVISNDFLSNVVDTNDEWISTRTGIRSRRVISGDETLTDLATEASRRALEMADIDPLEVDLIVLCTSTPDDVFGSACQVQAKLGCKNAAAFDLTAACSGFVMGLVTASRFINGGGYETVLVIGADALSRYVDWRDRGTCILFGDGSGAMVLKASPVGEGSGLLGFDMRSDGLGGRYLHAQIKSEAATNGLATGSNGAAHYDHLPGRALIDFIQMNGKEVFKFAVRAVPQVIEGALHEAELSTDDIDWLLMHQANQRILDAVAEKLSVPRAKVISNLANYGNTSAASIPLALDEVVRGGHVKPGDVLAIAGFGAGLTWASAIVRWQ